MITINPPILSAIVAMSENLAIGVNNKLPWHLPADLKHFKTITTGHPIIMGRKTYESIGKPLPNRTNIILTRDPYYQADGCLVTTSLDKAIEKAREVAADEIFVIGGVEVYQLAMPKLQRLYLTLIHANFAGDAFFPVLDSAIWQEVSRERHEADEVNPFGYSFLTLERSV